VLVIGATFTLMAASGWVTLGWGYPPYLLSPDLNFIISATTNLTTPFDQWTTLTNVNYTNCITTNVYMFNGNTNGWFEYRHKVKIEPGAMFFVCQASNFWGLTPTSDACSTPPLPVLISNSISITRTN
jgi:hypothetical protein